MKTSRILAMAVLAACLPVAAAWAAPADELIYQGALTDSGGDPLPDGAYDFRFGLWDAPAGGSQLWTEEVPVNVVGGAIAVPLGTATPFPENLFTENDALYLEVAADVDGNGFDAGETFSPRTALRATAYAFEAHNAARLGGVDAGAYALNDDVQAGIDSVSTAVVELAEAAESIQTSLEGFELTVTGLGTSVATLENDLADLQETVETLEAGIEPTVVRVNPGSSSAESGAALLAAIEDLTGPAVIKVAPGLYNLGTSTLVLPDGVDLAGYGLSRSVIQGGTGPGPIVEAGTNCEIRNIGFSANTPGDATAILVSGRVARLNGVGVNMINASGAGNHVGLFANDAASVDMTACVFSVAGTADGQGSFTGTVTGIESFNATINVRYSQISARNAGVARGILLENADNVILTGVESLVLNFGIGRALEATTSSIRVLSSRFEANGGQASSQSVGIKLTSGITTTFNHAVVSATANGGERFAYDAVGSPATLHSCSFRAPSGTAVRTAGGQVSLHHCILSGATSLNAASGSVRAAACQLDGATNGIITRFQCYDANFNAIP